jgi:hypothetical protein
MANSNTIFNDLLAKLQEVLNGFNCKSETRITEHDALLYGRFSSYMDKYNIVIHIMEEGYKPLTAGASMVEAKEVAQEARIMPSLELQAYKGQTAKCSEAEQNDIRDKFIKEANAIGREFMQKWGK